MTEWIHTDEPAIITAIRAIVKDTDMSHCQLEYTGSHELPNKADTDQFAGLVELVFKQVGDCGYYVVKFGDAGDKSIDISTTRSAGARPENPYDTIRITNPARIPSRLNILCKGNMDEKRIPLTEAHFYNNNNSTLVISLEPKRIITLHSPLHLRKRVSAVAALHDYVCEYSLPPQVIKKLAERLALQEYELSTRLNSKPEETLQLLEDALGDENEMEN